MDDQITKAREFAIKAHKDQLYGQEPYIYHLDMVVGILAEYGQQAQIIGYLHDTVEDTETSLYEIEVEFGKSVAQAVGILTDEPGDTREYRKKLTYTKMAKVKGFAEVALAVKAADRLANLRCCLDWNRQDKLQMYRNEHKIFRAAVFRKDLCDPIWKEIDSIMGF